MRNPPQQKAPERQPLTKLEESILEDTSKRQHREMGATTMAPLEKNVIAQKTATNFADSAAHDSSDFRATPGSLFGRKAQEPKLLQP